MNRYQSPQPNTLEYYVHPKQRLNTLFTVHAIFSLFFGAIGFLYPSLASYFFYTENKREVKLARAIVRLWCSLILAQGIIIWKSRRIAEGEIKRAFVQAYFVCFSLSTLALINEHMSDRGVMSGRFFGIMKIIVMICLTLGYGWFTFFQPPAVFMGLTSHY